MFRPGRILQFGGNNGSLSVLYFHRVLAKHDPLLPDEPTAETFDAMMGWVQRQFTVIPLAEGVARLRDGSLHLTSAFADRRYRNDELSGHARSVAMSGVRTVADTRPPGCEFAARARGRDQSGSTASMAPSTAGSSGTVVGRNRVTAPRSGLMRNFSKFHCTSPACPSASATVVSSA